jgi:hypothetical protein
MSDTRAVPRAAARWLFAIVAGLVILWTPGAIAQPAPHPAEPPAPPIPVEQMRAFGYTKAFAERFALPPPEPGWEPGDGLLAVEFLVRPIPGGKGLYDCEFKLYIDGRLDIGFPEPGPSGANELYTSRTHPFIARGKGEPEIPLVDRLANLDRRSAYLQLSAFATDDYEPRKRGALQSSGPFEFVRDLFPGLHYMNATNCSFATWLSRQGTGIKVWVKKSNGKDYRRDSAQDPRDFYQFSLPPALVARAKPWAEWVNDYSHWFYWKKPVDRNDVSLGQAPKGAGGD